MGNNSITKNKIIGFFKLTFIVTILNIIVMSLMYGANPFHFLNLLSLIRFSSSLNFIMHLFYLPLFMSYLLIIVGWLINYFISIKIFLPNHKNKEGEKLGKNDNKKVAISFTNSKLNMGGLLIALSGLSAIILSIMWSAVKTPGDFEIIRNLSFVPVILLTLGGFLIAFSNQK